MAVATVAEATAAGSWTQTDGDAIFNSDLGLVIGHRKNPLRMSSSKPGRNRILIP